MEGSSAQDFSALLAYFMGDQSSIKFKDHESLIKHLKTKGLFQDERAFQAYDKISRSYFFPSEQEDMSFEDCPVRLSKLKFNISAPHMYARCLSNLDIEPGMKFLDIGCGCGHMTALGAYLVGPTGVSIGIDIRQDIIDFAISNTRTFGLCQGDVADVRASKFLLRNCFLNDPYDPLPLFDRIHCGAACPKERLNDLLEYLALGGILVVPLESDLLKIKKHESGEIQQEVITEVSYGDLILPTEKEEKDLKIRIHKRSLIPDFTYAKQLNPDNLPLNDLQDFDVQINSDGTIIRAHKSVLADGSEYFKLMFDNPMKETQGNELLSIDIVKPPILLAALAFIYGQQINIDEENIHSLLVAADYFKIEGLMLKIEKILSESIDIESVCDTLSISIQYGANKLRLMCELFCLDHWAKVSSTEGFLQLPPECLRSLLLRFHSHISFLNTLSEHNEPSSSNLA